MAKGLLNNVKVAVVGTPAAGDITLGAAVDATYATPTTSGATSGVYYVMQIVEPAAFKLELVRAKLVNTSGTWTLSRSDGDAGNAILFSTAGAGVRETFSASALVLSDVSATDLAVIYQLAAVALSGAYGDLTGTPDLSTLAPKASPALTGTPTAPTAAGGANTTQIATTAFVAAAVAALINSSPGALDTLKELADALGDDANFAATMTTALAGKQPLDAELTALAGLTSGADLAPYFTGGGTAATHTLTAYGRTLAALASVGALQATLKAAGSDLRTGTDDAKLSTAKALADAMAFVALTDASTIAVDFSTFINASVTLGGNRTLGAPTNLKDGQSGLIKVAQDGTGSRTLSYASAWKFAGGAPTASTAAGTVDAIAYVVDGTVVRANLLKAFA